jgi:hypothetical protein
MSDFCHDCGSGTALNYSRRHGQLTGGEAGKSNRRGQPIYLDRPRPLRCTYGRIERKADSVLVDPEYRKRVGLIRASDNARCLRTPAIQSGAKRWQCSDTANAISEFPWGGANSWRRLIAQSQGEAHAHTRPRAALALVTLSVAP